MRLAGSILPEIDNERRTALLAWEKNVKIRFKNLNLLNLAFVHRSVSNEAAAAPARLVAESDFSLGSRSRANNERLEFLGDASLGAVTATILYSEQPEQSEGVLAKIKSVVVSAEILSAVALQLQIDGLLILGRGEELSGGRGKKALLADAMEALFGAYYIDSGYKAAFDFIKRCIEPEIERTRGNKGHQDYKSILQEECQRRWHEYPTYMLTKRSGPEHERYFWMEVIVNGQSYGPGMGRNKKTAEQEAARIAMEVLLIK
jgi:ribonuclease-3